MPPSTLNVSRACSGQTRTQFPQAMHRPASKEMIASPCGPSSKSRASVGHTPGHAPQAVHVSSRRLSSPSGEPVLASETPRSSLERAPSATTASVVAAGSRRDSPRSSVRSLVRDGLASAWVSAESGSIHSTLCEGALSPSRRSSSRTKSIRSRLTVARSERQRSPQPRSATVEAPRASACKIHPGVTIPRQGTSTGSHPAKSAARPLPSAWMEAACRQVRSRLG